MSRFVILSSNMKFGDLLVVMVWLLCHVAVFGHPTSSQTTSSQHEAVQAMLRISDELQSSENGSTDRERRPVRSESEILDDILKVLIESYQSEINKKGNYEPMLADQPWLNGSADQSKEKMKEAHLQMMKETAKQTRMIQVFNDILTRLGRPIPKNLPPTLDPTMKDNLQFAVMNHKLENVEYFTDITTMYPNCTLPPEIDKDEWFNNSNRLNMYFKSHQPVPRHYIVKVVQANLNLYKLPFKLNESNDGKTASAQDTNQKSDSQQNDNRTITAKLFYFKKPLRKLNPGEKSVRKILVDTKVLLASKAEKTQWNVTAAAQEWQNNSSRNLGLTIIVTDEKNRKLPAHLIFGSFDCSNATRPPPRIPTFIMDIIRQTNKTLYQDYQEKYEKLPTLDLTTKNIPEDEYDTDEDTNRKVRHERQKKNNKQKPKQHRNSSAESVEE